MTKASQSHLAADPVPQVADLDALEQAVNSAADRAGALWLSFLTLAAYLVVSVGSITHRNLLLETPIKMPILDVELPLTGFFIVAPIVFIIFHFYVLLHLHDLANKIASYKKELRESQLPVAARQLRRHRLDNFIFVQFLTAPPQTHRDLIGTLIRSIAWITVVALPFLVLLQMEFTYLPYHDESVVWLLRALIGIDAFLAWKVWRSVHRPVDQPRRLSSMLEPTAVCGIAVFGVGVFFAIFPGETIYNYVHTPITRFLFEGKIDQASGKARSPFANRLSAPDQNLIDPKQLAEGGVTVSLRGRDLRGAVLSRSDLRGADFTGSDLTDAVLAGAKLTRASFACADSIRITGCTDLRGADLARSALENAVFDNAQLDGASLEGAKLSQASLANASLTGADLRSADLDKATVTTISAAGASIDGASLNGALVDASGFDGTSAIDVGGIANLDLAGVNTWTKTQDQTPIDSQPRKLLAESLGKLFCDSDPAPFVAHGMISNNVLTHTGVYIKDIAAKLASRKPPCTGAAGLNAEDLRLLNEQVQRASQKE